MQPSIPPQQVAPFEQGPGRDPYQAYRLSHTRRSPRFTADRVVRFLAGVAVALAVGWVVWYFSNLLIFLVIGVLLSYVMRPLVDRLQGFGLGRITAILATFVLVFGAISLLMTKLVPFMGRQIADISDRLALQAAGQVVSVETVGQTEPAAVQAGELIVAVDGAPWGSTEQFLARVRTKRPGEVVLLTVEDADGMRRQVALAVRNVPEEAGAVSPVEDAAPVRLASLGVTVQQVPVSQAIMAIERRIRDVIPLEPGTLIRGVSAALDDLLQEERITQVAGSVVGIFTDIFYAILVIPFVAFFGLKDGIRIRHGLLRLVPNRYFEITLTIIEKIEAIIGRYFQALFVQCAAVASLSSALLYVAGLDYAPAVGIFAGVANTIPYFGPLMGFIAGTIVGIVQTGDLSLVPGVVVAMALTRVADDVVFQPFLFSRAAQMHPLIILFVVLMGAQLAGLVGMLLAIPVTTILRVVAAQILWSVRNYRILQSV